MWCILLILTIVATSLGSGLGLRCPLFDPADHELCKTHYPLAIAHIQETLDRLSKGSLKPNFEASLKLNKRGPIISIENHSIHTEGHAWTLSRWTNDLKPMLPYLPNLKLVTHHWDEPFVNLCTRGSAGVLSPDGAHGYYRESPQNKFETTFNVNSTLPAVFSSAKTDCHADILFPSVYHMGFQPWDPFPGEKEDVLFWRGSSTGQSNTLTTWPQNHRFKIMKWKDRTITSELSPSQKLGPLPRTKGLSPLRALQEILSLRITPKQSTRIDFGITVVHQCGNDCAQLKKVISELGYMAETSPMKTWSRYKYLLDIDGNSFSQRLQSFFKYSGSLVFRASIFNNWYDGWLVQPWKHYIPVNIDGSDLDEKIKYAHTHPKEVAEMIRAASKVGDTWFTEHIQRYYLFWLLHEYGARFNLT